MSRSSPPRSSIAEKVRQSSQSARRPDARDRSYRRKLSIRFAALARWLHIYVSMFGLAAVLFFSVTGLTLNHPHWVFGGAERTARAEGQIEQSWLHRPGPANESDPSAGVAKLEIVEYLRKTHDVRGALAEFKADEQECMVTFKGPGYAADAFIDRQSGHYTISQTFQGLVAVVNDLHKGRDTGRVWSLVIDLSAIVMTVISLAGLLMLFYLKRRRVPGLAVTLLGTIIVVAVYLLWVP